MTHYYLITRDTDDAVVRKQEAPVAGLVEQTAGLSTHEVTQAVYEQAGRLRHDAGSYRWSYTQGGGLVALADARPTVRITHPTQGLDVEFDVGDASTPLEVSLLRANGNVNTNFNQTRRVEIADRFVKLVWTLSNNDNSVTFTAGLSGHTISFSGMARKAPTRRCVA